MLVAAGPARAATPTIAAAGGGAGSDPGGIWAATWWAGNPDGGGATAPWSSGGDVCVWRDVGGSTAELDGALYSTGLPASFWDVPQSGGRAEVWGVNLWADAKVAVGTSGAHFDVVACPHPGLVPGPGADVETSLPLVVATGVRPEYLWIFWDTVVDPAPGALPPVVGAAFAAAHLPDPRPHTAPALGGIPGTTLVNLPTALSIDPAEWRLIEAIADGGGLAATVFAKPLTVAWQASWDYETPAEDPEHAVTFGPERLDLLCRGPGVPIRSAGAPCTFVFRNSTLGAVVPLTATITWQVTWTLVGNGGVVGGEGTLGTITTTGVIGLRVRQAESVITSG